MRRTMKCRHCNVNKLSNEFPQVNLTESCKHPRFHCMRCVIKHVKEKNSCPHPECGKPVNVNSRPISIIEHTLSEMFREYSSDFTPLVIPEGASEGMVRIAVMNGDSMTLPYSPQMTILQLKQEIHKELKHDVQKQKLLYNEKEMKTCGDSGSMMKLSDYKVHPNSTIYLVVLMYAIPEGFDHVVFDLYWGYPMHGTDYLDASCLLFNGTQYCSLADWCHRNTGSGAVQHSGDKMDSINRRGHHIIHVYLKKIPANVTHLFFTLSAWSSPNISRYPNPSLKFYEADKPNKDLCKTTFTHANHSQAVIMCSVSRSGAGWAIFESGKLSAGNASNYEAIIENIKALISQGF